MITEEEAISLLDMDHEPLLPAVDRSTYVGCVRRWGARAFNLCPHVGVDNTTTSTYRVPAGTPDTLTYQQATHRWKWNVDAYGIRCLKCYSKNLHGWHDDATDMLIKLKKLYDSHLTVFEEETFNELANFGDAIIRWCDKNLLPEQHYFLLAITKDRVDSFVRPSMATQMVIIVDCLQTKVRLLGRDKLLNSPNTKFLVLPMLRSATSYAGWRLIVASLNQVPAYLHIVNQSQITYRSLAIHALANLKLTYSSVEIGNVWPFFMGNALIKGNTCNTHPAALLLSFFMFGDCYGWDELFPAYHCNPTIVFLNTSGYPPILAPQVEPNLTNAISVCYALTDGRGALARKYVGVFNREIVLMMKRLSLVGNDDGLKTFFAGWFDPRAFDMTIKHDDFLETMYYETDPRNIRYQPQFIEGENILNEVSLSVGGLVFFTFGTRGDRMPVLANARRLASIGARATVIHLNTEAEGAILLSRDPNHEASRVALFRRARDVVLSYSCAGRITPHQLLLFETTRYSLQPPDSVIYPFRASDNALISLAYSLVGMVSRASFYIGAYAQPGYVPTSSNGVSSIVQVVNEDTSGRRVGAWWGSHGQAPELYTNIPVIPPGDHAKLFPKYSKIYCHGGAGTVALIAASGAQAIVTDDSLDRAYRNPHDAGVGVMPGVPDDFILLALGPISKGFIGVWMRANWYKPWHLLSFYGFGGFWMTTFNILMLWLFLSRTQRVVPLSSSPITSLLMMLFPKTRITIYQTMFAYFLSELLEKLMVSLGKNYFWLAGRFISLNITMVRAIIPFYIAQKYGYFWGLVTAALSNWIVAIAQFCTSWAINTLAPGHDMAGSDKLYIELTIRWHIIPVVHCALVSPSTGERFEGATNMLGLYTLEWRYDPPNGGFVFPTTFNRTHTDGVANMAYKYSLFWNCQTALMLALNNNWHHSGLGGIVILGVNLAVSMVSLPIVFGITALYGVALVVPNWFGVSPTRHGTTVVFGQMVSNLVDAVSLNTANMLGSINQWLAGLWTIAS
jgi:hypothetical protein